MEKETISFEKHDLSEPVEFTVLSEMESVSKNGNPTIKLGMKCKDRYGREFDNWLNYWLTASESAGPYTQIFLDNIDKKVGLEWGSDGWSGYNTEQKPFKFAKGWCTIKKTESGYYNINQFVEKPTFEESKNEAVEQPKSTISDNDIPF